MHYSIVTNTLVAVESPTDEQVTLIESLPRQDSVMWKKQQAYFAYLRDRKYWILCKCNGQALIHVKSGKNYYYLFSRISEKRAEHEQGCEFKAVPSGNTQRGGDVTKIRGTEYDFFAEKTGTRSEPKPENESTQSVRTRQSKLFRLIRHVMRDGNLHRIVNGQSPGYMKQRDTFLHAARGINMGGVPLNDLPFFQCTPKSLAMVRNRLFSTQFKQGQSKTALLIWIADTYEVNNDTLSFTYSQDKALSLNECRTLLHHARGDKNDGPFMIAVLYKYGQNKEGKNCFSYPSAYVIPILSKHSWILCDSGYEREMAKALESMARIEWKENGVSSVIEKPIEPLEGVGEGNVIPDFDVCVEGKRQFIEVMGYRTEEYIERKARVVPLMERVAPVDEFIAYRFSCDEQRQSTMFKYAVKVFKELQAP